MDGAAEGAVGEAAWGEVTAGINVLNRFTVLTVDLNNHLTLK